MKDDKKYIEDFIKDIEFDTPSQKHREVLKIQLLNAFPKHRLRPTSYSARIRAMFRNIVIRKSAEAAAIIIIIFLSIHLFLGGGSAITIAEVIEQMNKVVWMHAVTEETEYLKDSPEQVNWKSKSESWTSLNPFRYISVSSDGNICYDGYSSGQYINAQYHPMFNKITIKYPSDRHNNMPADPLQLLLMGIE